MLPEAKDIYGEKKRAISGEGFRGRKGVKKVVVDPGFKKAMEKYIKEGKK